MVDEERRNLAAERTSFALRFALEAYVVQPIPPLENLQSTGDKKIWDGSDAQAARCASTLNKAPICCERECRLGD